MLETYLRVLRTTSDSLEAEATARDEADRLAILAKHDQAQLEDWWAWETVERMVYEDPVTALSVLVRIIDATTSDEELAHVAAGHLEDLIQESGSELLDLLESEALRNPRLCKALSGIWLEDPPQQVKARVSRLLYPPYLPAYRAENWE